MARPIHKETNRQFFFSPCDQEAENDSESDPRSTTRKSRRRLEAQEGADRIFVKSQPIYFYIFLIYDM